MAAPKIRRHTLLFSVILLVVLGWNGNTVPPSAQAQESISFEGFVYQMGGTTPIVGVTVQLLTATTDGGRFSVVATTATDARGRFSFARTHEMRTDYRIHEVNPQDYTSTAPTAPRTAVIVDDDSLQFSSPAAVAYNGMIFYDSPIIAATSTPTPTRTRTPTPSPTPPPPVDLVADQLEVTQGVQDLKNSVRLVTNKRTYVRFHVHAAKSAHLTTAVLLAQRSGASTLVYPVKNIAVQSSPSRSQLDHAFLFELPNGFKQGSVTLTARVNPVLPVVRPNPDPVETNYDNNTASVTVSFEPVNPIRVVIFLVGYRLNGVNRYPPMSDAAQLVAWLKKAYPVSSVQVSYRYIYYGNAGLDSEGDLNPPDCGDVNSVLATKLMADVFSGNYPPGTRYYGLVSDAGAFMRGCAGKIPGLVASGPSGPGTYGWDYDGSYGDWYGGHELAHTYGRYHAAFCDADGGVYYPYPGGRISPTLSGDSALFGFDIDTRQVYGPSWHDVMTYCKFQWVSDFTYHALMNYFQTSLSGTSLASSLSERVDRLMVNGTIDALAGTAEFKPLYIFPDIGEVTPRVPGAYAIVLRGTSGQELARYAFTPTPMESGPPPEGGTGGPVGLLLINELVPYVEGTVRVELEHASSILAFVTAGLNPPTVTLLTPNGGEVLSSDPVPVTWTAEDPDGDPLYFDIQYSRDNGATWELLAQNVTDHSVALEIMNVGCSSQGLFRVWASDGIHTASDQSDGTFTVPNRPPVVTIIAPALDATIAVSQTLALVGDGYDPDQGTMPDEQLAWSSNLDGALGQGAVLSLASLSQGTHLITLHADDDQGGVATDTRQVTVVADLALLPPVADKLLAAPELISLASAGGPTSAELSIENENAGHPVSWSAAPSQPWVGLSSTSGMTPQQITVSLVEAGLDPGHYEATILLTSADLPGQSVTVYVEAEIPSSRPVHLPLVLRGR